MGGKGGGGEGEKGRKSGRLSGDQFFICLSVFLWEETKEKREKKKRRREVMFIEQEAFFLSF